MMRCQNMPDHDLAQWLQTRSFYALLILGLLAVGLLLALWHRRRDRPGTPHKPAAKPGQARRKRR